MSGFREPPLSYLRRPSNGSGVPRTAARSSRAGRQGVVVLVCVVVAAALGVGTSPAFAAGAAWHDRQTIAAGGTVAFPQLVFTSTMVGVASLAQCPSAGCANNSKRIEVIRAPGSRQWVRGPAVGSTYSSLAATPTGSILIGDLLRAGRPFGDQAAAAAALPGLSPGPLYPLAGRPQARRFDQPLVAAAIRNGVLVAWARYGPEPVGSGCAGCETIYARERRNDGSWGPLILVASHQTVSDLQIATNVRGDAVVAWLSGSYDLLVRMRMRVNGGRWRPLRRPHVPQDFKYSDTLASALSPTGDALLAWASFDSDPNGSDTPNPVRALLVPFHGRPGSVTTLASDSMPGNGSYIGLIFARWVSARTALVEFTDQAATGFSHVDLAVLRRGHSIETRSISNSAANADAAGLAVNHHGRGFLLWRTHWNDPQYALGQGRSLRDTEWDSSHGLQPSRPVSSATAPLLIDEVALAVDPLTDRPQAIWTGGRTHDSELRAASG